MSDATRIEETRGLPEWTRRAALARFAVLASVEARFNEVRDDVAVLLQHVRAICGDEDARAWLLAIGIDKAALRRVWRKTGARKPKTPIPRE
jgi:hypothetical protein